ncbi:DUF4350 domain-containing protein [Chryseobacterium koreense]|uniref:DUF4350 domain-containing protein n=1 Tax=Chryseobacterium koreense CCUG 49689 TaxID=1304281 RepID=A0A0J7LNR6_9FLAO|nr:DUF4350 domain-containing protein [Chryseobacterium koreense]KMQ70720.1 hypothetical protein ACM44_10385 [Chryseobacterium koreense CCUG 49689]MBB5333607.1 hypothetical protein [Chryseobacterium koreense]
MNKHFKIYGILLVVVVVILILLELGKSGATDFRKNFDLKEKTAFGLYVFSGEANSLFKNKLSKTEVSPYAYFSGKTFKPQNILVIAKEIDQESAKKILEQVEQGADFMLISENFPSVISEEFGIADDRFNFDPRQILYLENENFASDSLLLDKLPGGIGFYDVNEDFEILGSTYDRQDEENYNFVKINYGKGHIYLHSEPLFLTNYYLLRKGSEKYLQDVFSYLPDRETVWFVSNSEISSSSPLRFILSNPALRYAWWLFLGGLLLFVIFNVKRKQRIVPIIEPLRNKSVEFVRSIGNLYLQEGDFHDMMSKKAQYFLNKVRMDLLIDTTALDENFAQKLHLKTGKPIEKIKEAIELMERAQNPYSSVMKEDLIRMNRLLDEII